MSISTVPLEVGSSGNNQGRPPSMIAQTYQRDSKYWFEDGGVIFVVGEALFKLHKSMLAADPEAKGYEFERLMKNTPNASNLSLPPSGVRSEVPRIFLPSDVKAAHFRAFLLAVLGRIGDKDYTDLVTASQKPASHCPQLVGALACIGTLAARFGMHNLDLWVQSQISLICVLSRKQLTRVQWDRETIWQLIGLTQATHARIQQHEIIIFLQFILCKSLASVSITENRKGSLAAGRVSTVLHIFGNLFNDKSVRSKNLGLFGFVFAIILSLGHRSSVWADHLSKADRRILYIAHTDMTRLCEHDDLGVDWLIHPETVMDICTRPECSRNFGDFWSRSFAQCGAMDSAVPLEDIRHIARIPLYRDAFRDGCLTANWQCKQHCAEKTLSKIDARIERVFRTLAEKHRSWARTA